MRLIGRRPLAFAILYTCLSLAVEIVLIVVLGLTVPEHNAVVAPIVLTVPPLLAAACSDYRRSLRDFCTVAALTSVLTLVITLIVTGLTGISTGLAEPILNRSFAGALGALTTNRLSAQG